jgi:hypothetical protein
MTDKIEYSKPWDQWSDSELLAAVTDQAREVWGERTADQIRTQLMIYQRLPRGDEPGFRPQQYSPLTGLQRTRDEEGGEPAQGSSEGIVIG